MNLDDVRQRAASLSPWAHIATVRDDGTPDVTPVHPCWDGDTLWIMVFTGATMSGLGRRRNRGTVADEESPTS